VEEEGRGRGCRCCVGSLKTKQQKTTNTLSISLCIVVRDVPAARAAGRGRVLAAAAVPKAEQARPAERGFQRVLWARRGLQETGRLRDLATREDGRVVPAGRGRVGRRVEAGVAAAARAEEGWWLGWWRSGWWRLRRIGHRRRDGAAWRACSFYPPVWQARRAHDRRRRDRETEKEAGRRGVGLGGSFSLSSTARARTSNSASAMSVRDQPQNPVQFFVRPK
jgi:hypothetical protein